MSLKNFHLVFIALAALCCLGFAMWTWWIASVEVLTPSLRGAGMASAFGAVVLAGYGIRFYRKASAIIT
jgi:hypothetical protein